MGILQKCALLHSTAIGKAADATTATPPTLPTKESKVRKAHATDFDGDEAEVDDGFFEFQEAEAWEAA